MKMISKNPYLSLKKLLNMHKRDVFVLSVNVWTRIHYFRYCISVYRTSTFQLFCLWHSRSNWWSRSLSPHHLPPPPPMASGCNKETEVGVHLGANSRWRGVELSLVYTIYWNQFFHSKLGFFYFQEHGNNLKPRYFRLQVYFHLLVSPKPLSIWPFWIFSEIRGGTCSSRRTTGVIDTSGKWKKSSTRKVLTMFFWHLWVAELTYR